MTKIHITIIDYVRNQLRYKRKYRNNVLHGTWKKWHPNGQLRKRVKYVYGLKHGVTETWNARGVKIQEINYVDNIKERWNTLYVNGRVTQSSPLK